MPSLSARVVRLYIEWIRRPKDIFASADRQRENIQAVFSRPASYLPPANLGPGIVIHRIDLNEWPLYRLSMRSASDEAPDMSRPAMVYLHGGAFYKEINAVHWKFVAQFASETGLDVLVPIYPLIPRPTASALQAAEGVAEICRLYKQPVVCLAGDSAGGAIALSSMQHLLDTSPVEAARIQSVVLISPILDSALDHPELVRLAETDPWLGLEGCRVLSPMWAAGLPIKNPIASPLYVDIERLPPVMVLAGTADMLCADARRLSARFQNKGSDECISGSVELEKFTYVEEPDMLHVYPLLPHWEGAQARKLIFSFVLKHLQ